MSKQNQNQNQNPNRSSPLPNIYNESSSLPRIHKCHCGREATIRNLYHCSKYDTDEMDSICDYVEVEEQQTREERSNEEVFSTPATIEIIRAMTTRKSENTLQDKFEIIDLLNDTSSDLEEFTDTAVNDNVSSKDGGTLVRDTSPIVSSFSQNTIQSSQRDTQSTVAQSPSRKAKGKSVSKVSKSPQSQLLKKDKAQVVTTHRYETRSKPSRRHTSLSSSNNHNDDNRSDDVSQRSQKLKRSNNDGNAAVQRKHKKKRVEKNKK